MEASKVEIRKNSLDYYDKPLTRNKRFQLRVNLAKDLIKSKPAGTRITSEEFRRACKINTSGYISTFLDRLVKRNVIVRTPLTRGKGYSYDLPENVKTIVPPKAITKEVVKEVEKEVEAKKVTSAYDLEKVQKLAKEYAWVHNTDSLRGFVFWLDTLETNK